MQHAPLFDFIAKQNLPGVTNEDFLKKVVKQHPYFTPAHFFLLQQLPESGSTYTLQAGKTNILFNNPHWLYFQLQHPGVDTIIADEMVNANFAENADNDDDAIAVNAAPATFVEIPGADESKAPTTIPEEQTQEPIALTENTGNNDDEAITVTAEQPLTEEQLMLAEDPTAHEEEMVTEEEIAPIKITMPDMNNNATTETAVSFEPMHLVDYFASQGIKLSDEIQPADKLGKQLKSFTEWLKTMKKIHVTDTEANAGISDIAVQALAAKSNKEGEIVTEAMAEVLLQQGKAGKAIEVYKKLSLLNPSKSAFFAAKIEQLKGS